MFDEIGYWSEVKLDIIRQYAAKYSLILSTRTNPSFYHVYIDAFAGSGKHISRKSRDTILGSPLIALDTKPPFKEYYFIDIDGATVTQLKKEAEKWPDSPRVTFFQGDCNPILLTQVFPKVRREDYRRGLCLLDPYGLDLDWEVIKTAGQMGSIEIFLNFPVMDINRNALRRNPNDVTPEAINRMNRYWGDDSWRRLAYPLTPTLFGEDWEHKEININTKIANAFRERLKQVAGFSHVPQPMPMRNSKGAIVYYLFFAAQQPIANDIVKVIFKKYGGRGTE